MDHEPPSGLQKLFQALADFFMREILAALQRFLALLHGLDKTALLCEIPRDHPLHEFVRVAAMLNRTLHELGF